MPTFAIPIGRKGSSKTKNGAIAQLVEQRTENPCVPGSIPGGTTENLSRSNSIEVFFVYALHVHVTVYSGIRGSTEKVCMKMK